MTEPMTHAEVAEYRRLAEAATKGPWKQSMNMAWSEMLDVESPRRQVAFCQFEKDAAFIAASREAVPRLCDEWEGLTDRCASLEREVDHVSRMTIEQFLSWRSAVEQAREVCGQKEEEKEIG